MLKENGITKRMSVPNTQFYVVDDRGNKKAFTVNIPPRDVALNRTDILNVVDACLAVMEDCIKRGEDLTFYGIGTLGLKWRAPRMVKAPGSDEWMEVPEHYVPCIQFGNVLKTAARIYEASLHESRINTPDPIYDIGDRPMEFSYDDYYGEDDDEEDGGIDE